MIKLGPHFMLGGQGLETWLAAKPTVAKFVDNFDGVKFADPLTLVVGRVTEQHGWQVGVGDPVASAGWYADMIGVQMQKTPRVDVWEGPNEPVLYDASTPLGQKLVAVHWHAQFSYEFARQIFIMGKRAAIGVWSVGYPDQEALLSWTQGLKALNEFQALYARHSYGPLDLDYAFRHKRDRDVFALQGFSNVKMLITECGTESVGGMRPWRQQYGGDVNAYFDQWVKPFHGTLMVDDYVIGATLFTLGGGGGSQWHDYDVAGTGFVNRVRELDVPQEKPPIGGENMYVVTAGSLNVRAHPWAGNVEPPKVGLLKGGDVIYVFGWYKDADMPVGWGCIATDGNAWVSGKYIREA